MKVTVRILSQSRAPIPPHIMSLNGQLLFFLLRALHAAQLFDKGLGMGTFARERPDSLHTQHTQPLRFSEPQARPHIAQRRGRSLTRPQAMPPGQSLRKAPQAAHLMGAKRGWKRTCLDENEIVLKSNQRPVGRLAWFARASSSASSLNLAFCTPEALGKGSMWEPVCFKVSRCHPRKTNTECQYRGLNFKALME